MRAIFLILFLAIITLIAAFVTGYVNVSQTREASEAGDGAIRAQSGQPPAFEVQTGSVEVGVREANAALPKVAVKHGKARVPSVEIRPAEEEQNNAD